MGVGALMRESEVHQTTEWSCYERRRSRMQAEAPTYTLPHALERLSVPGYRISLCRYFLLF